MIKYKKAGLLMLILSTNLNATTININNKIKIKPNTEIIQVLNEDDFLGCGTSSAIVSFECGNGTSINANGECEAETSTPFNLDWEVTDVTRCVGTQGTSEWQGQVAPYAGGTGSYTKRLYDGITETTTFGLECNVASYTITSPEQDTGYIKIDKDMLKANHYIIAWDGEKVSIEEKTKGYGDSSERKYALLGEGVTHYLEITDQEPHYDKDGVVIYSSFAKNRGLCSSANHVNWPAFLHISNSIMFKKTCALEKDKDYYLVMIKMYNSKRTFIN